MSNIVFTGTDTEQIFCFTHPITSYISNKSKIKSKISLVLYTSKWYTDIRKVLQHFHKSNATIFEWSNSPVVYYTTDKWQKLYNDTAVRYFSCKAALYHYYGTANKNYHEYLKSDMVKYKKYFYVLRPLLACRWIEEKKCPPPVLFDELFNTVLEENMKEAVANLLAKKIKMSESEKGPKVKAINNYIEEKLNYYKKLAESMEDDRNPDWDMLDDAFREIII